MSLTPPKTTASATGRTVITLTAGVALVALLFAVAMVVRSNDGADSNRVETAAGEDRAKPTPPLGKRPAQPTIPAVQEPAKTTSSTTTSPIPASSPTTSADAGTTSPTTRPDRTPNAPFSPTGPLIAPNPSEPSAQEPAEPAPVVEPAGPLPTGPTPEQQACNNLGLVAVGDPATEEPEAEAAWTRFRSARPQIPTSEDLVCAKPATRILDDLIVQELVVASKKHGVLVGGTDSALPVLWLSDVEWASYQWRGPEDANHNFTGMPTGRFTIGGHEMIRTTRGAVVMVRSDSWGHSVVSGAWDAWMASGGPTGPMGLPEGKAVPTITGEGAAQEVTGAHQDFTNGVLTLPGVTSVLEAEVMPASRYQWVPLTAEQLTKPAPAPNSIVEIDYISYYVDRAGVRHWLKTTSDWSCATYDLGAGTAVEMPGWQAAKAPLGAAFTCPSKP